MMMKRMLMVVVAAMVLNGVANAQTFDVHKYAASVETQTPAVDVPMASAAAGATGDIISTVLVLNAGWHEVNPVLSSKAPINAAQQAVTLVAAELLLHHLRTTHHTKLEKVLGTGLGVLGAVDTLHNAELLNGHRTTKWVW